MTIRPMKSFSLLSFMLLIAVVALIVSHLLTLQKLAVARKEARTAVVKYGHIYAHDKSTTYVSLFYSKEHSYCESGATAFRLLDAAAMDYVLHLTEWQGGQPSVDRLVPSRTVVRLSARREQVICVCGGEVRIRGETLMAFETPSRSYKNMPTEPFHPWGEPVKFDPDERIPL